VRLFGQVLRLPPALLAAPILVLAFALAEAGAAKLRIANRSADKATSLAAAVRSAHPGCLAASGEAEGAGFDLVMSTASLGMQAGDALPVDPSGLSADAVVADVIITPETTPHRRESKALLRLGAA